MGKKNGNQLTRFVECVWGTIDSFTCSESYLSKEDKMYIRIKITRKSMN